MQLNHLSVLRFESQYLAHPHEDQAEGKLLQKQLEALGIKVVNPFDRNEDNLDWYERSHSPEDAERVVERDLKWIEETDAVFAYVPKAIVCGTAMEIFYAAHILGKPVFILTIPQYRFHPWLMRHGQVFTDVKFAFEVLKCRKTLENYGFRIALTGRMGTGKSTLAEFLKNSFGFQRRSFAAKLKEMAREMFDMKSKDRVLLQTLGSKLREVQSDVWAKYVIDEINETAPLRVVIDDMRYLNEATALKENGFKLVGLYALKESILKRRPVGFTPETARHPSETETDEIHVDCALDTSLSIETTYRKMMEMLLEWK